MGEARFTYTQDDLIDAQKAWWSGNASWQLVLKLWAVLSISYGVIAFALSQDAPDGLRATAVGLAPAGALVVSLAVIVLGRLLLPGRARKAYREQKSLGGELTYRWDADGFSVVNDRGTNRLPWTMLHDWLDGPRTLLLCQSSHLFNAIPKRALAPGDIDALIDHLRLAKVRERKRFGLLVSKAGRQGKDRT